MSLCLAFKIQVLDFELSIYVYTADILRIPIPVRNYFKGEIRKDTLLLKETRLSQKFCYMIHENLYLSFWLENQLLAIQ